MFLRAIFAGSLFLCTARCASADLTQYRIRTTEWLVDQSRWICVVEFASVAASANPKVLHTIKGMPEKIDWPIKKPKYADYMYYGPPAKGTVQLLFISGENKLLQAVDLGRTQLESPSLQDVFYGVDQYGNVHLTASSLFDGIRAHMAAKPSQPVPRRKDSVYFRRRPGIEASHKFPFETSEETFILIVDFTVARRDHYLAQLRNGDCAQRVHAIHELSHFDDPKALAAIEAATKPSTVEPSYVFKWSDRRVHSQTDDVVRSAAKAALKMIRWKAGDEGVQGVLGIGRGL